MGQDRGANSLTANRARVLAIVGAIATAVGVVGFLAVVGGAVLWIRFDEVAIPADKAVAAIPNGELVAVGLSTLLPYIALAFVVVFLAFLFAADNLVPSAPATDVRKRWARDQSPPSGPATASAGETERGELSPVAAEAISAAEAVAQAADAAAAAARLGSETLAKQHRDTAQEASDHMQSLVSRSGGSLKDAQIEPAELQAQAQASLERAKDAVTEARRRRVGVRVRVAGAGVLLVALEIAIAAASGLPSFSHFVLLCVLGILLAAAAVTVGWRTRGFALFGGALFIAVLLFGTARTLYRTWDHPKLQPIAVLRSGPDSGMIGFYIAETSDRVYLARVDAESVLHGHSFERSLPRILVVPRNNVVAIAIGDLTERKAGLREAKELLGELCEGKVAEAPATAAGAGKSQAQSPSSPCPPA